MISIGAVLQQYEDLIEAKLEVYSFLEVILQQHDAETKEVDHVLLWDQLFC